jgi:nitrogenase subunit NifH
MRVVKLLISKLFLKYKLETKTVIEAEHKARTDEEYKKIVEQYSEAEMNLIKARYHYNNLDKYV